MKKNRKGFTFIEILVAIGILSIISMFALSGF
jgi:prepilin-type N-terminal cleavage/methylation domain-containing protein